MTITPCGEIALLRTIKNRTPKPVQAHTQPPVGLVICPHCHEETNINAAGMYNIIGQPHPYQKQLQHSNILITVNAQTAVCIKCSGRLSIDNTNDALIICPMDIRWSIREAQEISDQKNARPAEPDVI